MKYFVRGWDDNIGNTERVLKEYSNYDKMIKNQIPKKVQEALNQHDNHIRETYFKENDYIMELEGKIWGTAFIIFKNAIVQCDSKLEDDYWRYDEIYLLKDKYEIHILFDKTEIIIECDDVYINVQEKEYWTILYEKEDYSLNSIKENIIQTVIDKEIICGYDKLKKWEQLIYSFYEIYLHIHYYNYNSIDEAVEHYPYYLSEEEKQDRYKALFADMEERLIRSIKALEEYREVIKEKELDEVISKLLEVYNKKGMTEQAKSQLYRNLNKDAFPNLEKLYKKILIYMNNNATFLEE